MAEKTPQVTVEVTLPPFVGYSDCMLSAPIRVGVRGEEGAKGKLTLVSKEGLLSVFEREIELRGGEYQLSVPLFSPEFLARCDALLPCTVEAKFLLGKKEISGTAHTLALPFDWWEGIGGPAERLACFVRPSLPETASVLAAAKARIKGEFSGYGEGAERVLSAVSALYFALKAKGVRREEADFRIPVPAAQVPLPARTNSLLLALFACSCLEEAGLHPFLAVGEKDVGAGVWLYDASMLDPVTDDKETVGSYLSDGVRNLCCFDADDLFRESAAPFSAARLHFERKLSAGKYSLFLDVRRARACGYLPCPLRGEKRGEVYREPALPLPSPVPPSPVYKWEGNLFDLTFKNPLLDFSGKNAVHLPCDDPERLFSRLREGKVRFLPGGEEAPPFGARTEGSGAELFALELNNGVLRPYGDFSSAVRTARTLFKRNKEAEEETGARVLFLACGFLRYRDGEEKFRRAPVLLVPVSLSCSRAGDVSLFISEEERFPNGTLAEYLRRTRGISLPSGQGAREIFAAVRGAVSPFKGWSVTEDVYLGAFSFPRFLLWNDLHRNFSAFSSRPLVRALLEKTPYREESRKEEKLLLPLPCDSSQARAVALSDRGVSFVLHGPPGTGKSQTIADIIANALGKGRRVLFVSAKRAAAEVVKARLDKIGIGDFCLCFSEGTKGEEAAGIFLKTLSLNSRSPDRSALSRKEEAEETARLAVEAPARALLAKDEGGMSAFGAISGALKYGDAPACIEARGGFSPEERTKCEELVRAAVAAAKECPRLEGVGLLACTPRTRERVLLCAELFLLAVRHLKPCAELLFKFFGQSAELSFSGLRSLVSVVQSLRDGKYAAYFCAGGEELLRFLRADKTADEQLSYYNRRFRYLVRADIGALAREERGGSETSRTVKKLKRAARGPFNAEDTGKYLKTLKTLLEAERTLKSSPLSFGVRGSAFGAGRKKFLRPLYELKELCGEIFSGFEEEGFFSACARASDGSAEPLFRSFLSAAEELFSAREALFSAVGKRGEERTAEELSAFAEELIGNIDLLRGRCERNRILSELRAAGVRFLVPPETLSQSGAAAGFRRALFLSYLNSRLPADPALSVTEGELTAKGEEFLRAKEETRAAAAEYILSVLLSRLPEGEERREAAAYLARAEEEKVSLRSLLYGAPEGVRRLAPCLLMSPSAVARYLPPDVLFDIAVFDEASQLTAAEAVMSVARAKSVVVAGDPKQLPPSSFFRGGEEKSVLDELLSLGFPEAHLLWHYRSRHESLIAFSNAAYYGNSLLTIPSPVRESRVKLVPVRGVYERGGTKRNRAEAEALTDEVVRRLQDGELSRLSMGVVTFSEAQQELVERLLAEKISLYRLEQTAYEREEPLFCKNLENVQGDERDVVLFSVGYGPDGEGKVSLNFGPLSREGGWRRLNVALSRAREEMLVYTSLHSSDLAGANSEGVKGLKNFLKWLEQGALAPSSKAEGEVLPEKIAEGLEKYGYSCSVNFGFSKFKVDVAVCAPGSGNYLLAVLCDGKEGPAEEGAELPRLLKRAGWEVERVCAASFFRSPEREWKRLKERLDMLSGKSRASEWLSRCVKPYRKVRRMPAGALFLDGIDDETVKDTLERIVSVEAPISRSFLKKRCLQVLGVRQTGDCRLDRLIDGCAFPRDRAAGVDYFYRDARSLLPERARAERGVPLRKEKEDFTAYEILSLVRGALREKVALYEDEVCGVVARACGVTSASFENFIRDCVAYGESRGVLVRSSSDRLSLA